MLLNYLKENISRFGSATQVLPSDIEEYFSSIFIAYSYYHCSFYLYFYFVTEKHIF